ncbi:MAG: MBL fold metallo-hydrolase [Gammaproteobacteria bacterium]|nr:MBL fold metallo-hydrolase [Gammaproteobacteria bacterium]NIR83983.1 MBL fold metallo-hydrolase [Gammaproteobacteria bacterium]NIR89127.1 MBL fold metallo-hydrolase [Gammaproteobacteria bacterium]NIU04929.1 MBL fold metallo-hydrolase [Gammaproteobacteria bacterium]NIV52095.1 MBL fold metallo-hydrolase [Gammaproteobacteria bacterium]
MQLTFLGTRANIPSRTRRHRRHSALLVAYGDDRIMVDCGGDWRRALARVDPSAIVLTHAHPDHAAGLEDGASCPVFATDIAWEPLLRFPIPERRTVATREPFVIGGVGFEAFEVEHSLRAPAVGYRITTGGASVFYVPDVVSIPERADALRGIALYIGDGSTMTRPIVRSGEGQRFGHAAIRTQLDWCAQKGVPRALFTHCGSQIVRADERMLGARLRALARPLGVTAGFARDGLVVEINGGVRVV